MVSHSVPSTSKKPRNYAPNADSSQPVDTKTQPTDGQTPQLPETPQLATDDWTKDDAAHTVTDSWAKAEGGYVGK
jgi:hypothetical protein